MKQVRLTSRLLPILLIWFTGVAEVPAQCSMCRAVLETEASGEAAEGINNGIVYLMVFPYILVGLAIYMVYRSWRKRSAEAVSY